ncbi:hypothetical protein AVEN_184670-1 [Araneus ventricosus]|uniref:Uncharacterized protein n=1 Tax=Araneus ventricosus TaxID=182803 RepID=A0A4Y2FTH2_ARAVE|nr:hypothetical protein AVEN_184670-1 [Araneus ventricosus]
MDWARRTSPLATQISRFIETPFFLRGHLKSLIYVTPVDSVQDLVALISIAAARVREILGIFESVHQSLHRHCQACVTVRGRNFEQLL